MNETAYLYRVALAQCGGDTVRARAMVERYLQGRHERIQLEMRESAFNTPEKAVQSYKGRLSIG